MITQTFEQGERSFCSFQERFTLKHKRAREPQGGFGLRVLATNLCERIVDPPHATGALVAAAYRGGAKVLNLTRVVDLILRRDGVLEGVVVNNTTAEMAGHDFIHVDPIGLESKIVVDATGHDAVVVNLLHKRNLYTAVPGNGAMWVSRSEEDVMNHTGEVYPNCFVIGLAVAAVHGTPRMGPAFGSMLLSGRYGAELIKKKLKQE